MAATPPGPADGGPSPRGRHAVRRRAPRTGRVLVVGIVLLAVAGAAGLVLVRRGVLPDPFGGSAGPPPSLTTAATTGPATTPSTVPTASPAPTPTPSPTRSTPTGPTPSGPGSSGRGDRGGASGRGTLGPTPVQPPSRPPRRPTIDTSLDHNTLYSIDLGPGRGRCDVPVRRADPPLPDDEVGAYLRRLVRCMSTALAPTLSRSGILLVTPEVKVYRSRVATPCGTLRPTSAPAYYCSGDGIIYFPAASDDADEAYTYARLGYLALVAHEYGHHLQFASGMFADYTEHYYRASIGDRDAISRRLELQADCFAGVFLGYVGPSVGLGPTDRDELDNWHRFTGDEDPPADRAPDHGTSKAQIHWLDRGLDSADYGRCNTWTADPDQVR